MKYMRVTALKGAFLTVALLASTSFFALQAKTVWLEEDDYRSLAQGDADTVPADFSLTTEEMTLTQEDLEKASQNIQKETRDESNMPTLTAEGGFLLPTYVLPDATSGTPAPASTTTVDQTNPWRAETKLTTIEEEINSVQMPAAPVVLQGATTTTASTVDNSTEDKLLQTIERQYQDTTNLLAETSKRLEALETGVQDLKASNMKMAGASAPALEECAVRRQPLLLPLAPLKTAAVSQSAPQEETARAAEPEKPQYIDYVLEVIKRVENEPVTFTESDEMVIKTIPQEMKLNFLPGSVDISTQSFKWIKAFSYAPKQAMQKAVEVRMSAKDIDLQSRRFALIKGALLSNGLSPRQIRFVMTDRDPDTIVLRTIVLPDEQEVIYTYRNGRSAAPQIIRKW